MGKPELGLKCTCVNCAERFYDLRRVPAVCPKCATEQPKAKPRVYAPGRPAPRRWADRPPTFPGGAPADVEAPEAETAEGLDDADEPEVDEDDEDVAATEVDDATDAEPHRD